MAADICTVIAFDYGERRIGVAVGQTLSATAEPLVVLKQHNGKVDWVEVQAIIDDWRPDQFVVGLPQTADGKAIPIHKSINEFSEELTRRFKLPVALCDEHLSSHAAKQSSLGARAAKKYANKHKRRTGKRASSVEIDAIAAQLILESWLSGT